MEDSEIIELLKDEFDVSDRQIQELLSGLHEAHGYHKDMGAMYFSEISIKDYKSNICKAHDAIKRLNASLSSLPDSNKLVIDDYYRQANESDMMMINLADGVMLQTGEPVSGFQQVAQRMEKALKLAEENVRTPGAGGAKRTGKEYIAAIEMLARWFSDVFPENKVSATPNTPFYRYAQLWFRCFVDLDDNDKDIRRHIANTLNHPHVTLHHD